MREVDIKIDKHWSNRHNVIAVQKGLAAGDSALEAPSVEGMAPRDQMHAGTLDATKKFASWAGVGRGDRILDLGAGMGGAARFLAREFGARVTALDPCEALHRAGESLTERMELGGSVDHVLGGFEHPGIRGAGYGLVWIQHVDMQIADKAGLYRAALGAIADSGRIVWHDWLAGDGGDPLWPMFWSPDGEISFAADEGGFRARLEEAGLRLARFEPVEELTVAWFEGAIGGVERAVEKLRAAASETKADRLAMMENLLLEMNNAIENTRSRRLVPFFAEAERR